MKNETTTEIEPDSAAASTDATSPKKILLGKRVLRHFKVRSSLQTGEQTASVDDATGEGTNGSVRMRCG